MRFTYPHTPILRITEILHGQEITDDYRWLEDMEDPKTQDWITQQNRLTRSVMNELPVRKKLVDRLSTYLNSEKIDTPKIFQDRVFYLRRKVGQNQPILYYRHEEEPESAERIVLDPNKEDEHGIVSLDWWFPSEDGRLLAYGLSKGGDEWSTLHIRNIETGEIFAERIPRCRFAQVVWINDSSFYYCRYPEVGEYPLGEENFHVKVFYHQIGTDWKEDPIIFGKGLPKEAMLGVALSKDKRYLFAYAQMGWIKNLLYLTEFNPDKPQDLVFKPLITDFDSFFYGYIREEHLYLFTNYKAPRFQVLKIDLQTAMEVERIDPDQCQIFIPEDSEVMIDYVIPVDDKLILGVSKDASSYVKIHDSQGKLLGEVNLPSLGTVNHVIEPGNSGKPYLVFQSFVTPAGIYRLDPTNFELELWSGVSTDIDPHQFTIKQVFYKSKDNTRVPMFILHRKDLHPSGQTPTVLFGYGGFSASSTPVYNSAIFPWLENGGIFAVANIRGGSEYGEEWHHAGMRGNKQNVFDDFIYAGKYLISEGYTDSLHLGVHGRSNGGLLVGAVMTQEPSMFQAVVCGVPLLDMLRFHKFLLGSLWTGEYGSPEIAEEFDWIYKYSPYHHVQEGIDYPATFFYAAASDSRVHPLHAMKMAARLQQVSSPEKPIFLNIEFDAGHGVGKPICKMVDEQADIWSFMAWRLGLTIN